ncbi:MAG: CHAD domain-containing protein [Syntrophomonadaceae bacterium]
MSGPQEVELKLRLADASDYPKLANDHLGLGQFNIEQVRVNHYATTYYDTSGRNLYQNGYTYRIRKAADSCTATVKDQGTQGGGLSVRGEWNIKLDSPVPSIEPFSSLPIGSRLASIVGEQQLLPLFRTDFQRTAIDLRTDSSLIELAADQGSIDTDQATAPICEVELELKDGLAVELLKVGAILAESYPLLVEEKSKYARGLELLGLPWPEGGERPELNVEDSIGTAIRSQGIFYLQEILAGQEKFLAQPGDPETVHQLRVKTRHLRSWLAFFKPVLQADRYADLTGLLKEFAGRLGYIRELDVLAQVWQEVIHSHPDLLAGAVQLSQRLAAEREQEQAAVYQQLAAGASTPGLLRVWAGLLEGSWDEPGPASQPLQSYLRPRLRKWRRRLVKGIKRTDFGELQSVHALRIQAKKLRYVLQTLDPVVSKRYRRRLPAVKAMQEQLGLICDAQRNVAIIQALTSGRKNSALQYESGILTGFLLCQAAALAQGWGKTPADLKPRSKT